MSVSLDSSAYIAYDAVRGDSLTDWLILGYRGTRDKLSVYSTGEQGVVELKTKLLPEVLFGLLNMDGRMMLWTFLPEDGVSGVQRARALVHSRAVGAAFGHDATLTASSPTDFNLVAIRSKLRLDGQGSVPASPMTQQSPAFSSPTSPSHFSGPYQRTTPQVDDRPPALPEKPASPVLNGGGVPGLILGNQRSLSPPQSATTSRPNSPDLAHLRQQQPRQASGSSQRSQNHQTEAFVTSPVSNGHAAPSSSTPNSTSPRPENEWRQQTSERGASTSNEHTLAQAMLSSSLEDEDEDDAPAAPHAGANGSAAPQELAQREEEERRAAEEQREREAHELAQAKREREQQEREDATRLERERREREAAERAREAAEKDARAQWEYERREREKLELAERLQLEREEKARREAAERLRREEQRRAEEKERAELEKARREEEERTRLAKIEMEKLVESQRLEKKLKEEAELKRKAEEKLRERAELQQRFADLKPTGEIMLKGHVSVQGGASMLWRRRWFELRGTSLSLYKSEVDTTKAVDTIPLPKQVQRIVDNPEEASMPNSFKLAMQDDDEWFFYTDQPDDKELLVAGLSMSAEL
ncbi:hypothetical protein BCR35DRAFT_306418 [Leucosporidium creatinivorum]|uniref:PH domain-containing protein n=1 Tax=Leucosporidium creatinivorum TaxID=106004 RepID=A0A1Y2ETW6_9BASI|nr:hypothetical protein BCR35DRAFT_306418 [Leucosporidium creatinivorum]